MPRDSKVDLEDILEATRRIRSYTKLSALEAEVTAMLEE